MICVKCDQDLAECVCDDCTERIQAILKCEFIAFGEEYLMRLVMHAEEMKDKCERKD